MAAADAGWLPAPLRSKPYTRIPAYLVGVSAALAGRTGVLAALDAARVDAPLGLHLGGASPAAALRGPSCSRAGWLVALASSLCTLGALIVLPTGNFRRPNSWPLSLDAAYLTFVRPAWACALAVLVAACRAMRGNPVDAFLSHRVWVPLARLTFGAYLVHPVIIKVLAANATAAVHFSPQDLAARAVMNVMCARTHGRPTGGRTSHQSRALLCV